MTNLVKIEQIKICDRFRNHVPNKTDSGIQSGTQISREYARSWLSMKVYYVPLYFSIYFTIYIGYLILKAISRHKIKIPPSTASSFLLFARNSHDYWIENFIN